MQGALDDNVLPAIQEKFAATYRAAGGDCRLEIFESCEHEWVAKPGPQTDRAHEMVKPFIARNLTRCGALPDCVGAKRRQLANSPPSSSQRCSALVVLRKAAQPARAPCAGLAAAGGALGEHAANVIVEHAPLRRGSPGGDAALLHSSLRHARPADRRRGFRC